MLNNRKEIERNINSSTVLQKIKTDCSSKNQSENEAPREKDASLVGLILSDAVETTQVLSQSIYMRRP